MKKAMETPVYVGSTYRCNTGRGAEVVIRLLSNDFNRMNDESSTLVIFQLTEGQAPNTDRSWHLTLTEFKQQFSIVNGKDSDQDPQLDIRLLSELHIGDRFSLAKGANLHWRSIVSRLDDSSLQVKDSRGKMETWIAQEVEETGNVFVPIEPSL